VVQSDLFGDLASVTVLPITGTLINAPLLRLQVELSEQNGLAQRSQITVDKPQTPSGSKLGPIIGHLDDGGQLHELCDPYSLGLAELI